jgi:hypothetical protein
MPAFIDLAGKRYGDWLVVSLVDNSNDRHIKWNCLCNCGRYGTPTASDLRSGRSLGCAACSRKKCGIKLRLPTGEAGFNKLLREYIYGAQTRTIEFSLSVEEFRSITSLPCFYCNKLPSQISRASSKKHTAEAVKNSEYIYNGIDRVDNKLGYTADNVVPCCKRCNDVKNDATLLEILHIHAGLQRFIQNTVSTSTQIDNTPTWFLES